jgi:hypothetical protein
LLPGCDARLTSWPVATVRAGVHVSPAIPLDWSGYSLGPSEDIHLRQLVARLTFTSMPNSSTLRDGPKDDPALFNQSLRKFPKVCRSTANPSPKGKTRFDDIELVGTGRFELPTPRTPSECSTRLSHVPTTVRLGSALMSVSRVALPVAIPIGLV